MFCPEMPNRIQFGLYAPQNTIWLSIAGYDAGYMYAFVMDKEDPLQYTMIADSDDIKICSYLYK